MATWASEHKTGWMDWMGDTTGRTSRAPADRGVFPNDSSISYGIT